MSKIKNIEVGWGNSSRFFTTNKLLPETSPNRVDRIAEERKQIGDSESIFGLSRI